MRLPDSIFREAEERKTEASNWSASRLGKLQGYGYSGSCRKQAGRCSEKKHPPPEQSPIIIGEQRQRRERKNVRRQSATVVLEHICDTHILYIVGWMQARMLSGVGGQLKVSRLLKDVARHLQCTLTNLLASEQL